VLEGFERSTYIVTSINPEPAIDHRFMTGFFCQASGVDPIVKGECPGSICGTSKRFEFPVDCSRLASLSGQDEKRFSSFVEDAQRVRIRF